MRAATWLGLATSILVACGGGTATVAPRVVVASAPAPAHGRWPEPWTPRADAWRTTEMIPFGEARVVGAREDGALLVLDVGRREVLAETGVTAAHDGTPDAMLAVARIAGAWVFAYQDGAILRTEDDDFLGPLSVVTRTETRLLAAEARGEALLLRTEGPHAWIFDADGLRELRPWGIDLPRWPTLGAAMHGPTRIAIVTEPGVLWVTEDGARFTRIALGDHVATGVERGPGDGWLVRTEGPFMAVEGTQVREVDAPALAPPDARPGRALTEEEAARLDAERRVTQAYDVALAPGPRGGILGACASDGACSVWSPARGLERIPSQGEACTWRSLGDGALGSCGEGPRRIWVSGAPGGPEEVGGIWATGPLVVSEDGSSFGAMGTCTAPSAEGDEGDEGDEEEDEQGPPTPFCWHDGTRFVQTLLPANGDVLALHRAYAILTYDDAELGRRLGILDLSAPEAPRPLDGLPDSVDLDDRDSFSLGLAADGAVHGMVADGATLRLLLGELDGTFVLRDLPDGATHVDLADRFHGVAHGLFASQMWTTGDGGATWTPVPLGGSGDPHEYAILGEPLCGGGGCRIGRSIFYGPADRAGADPGARILWAPNQTRAHVRPRSLPGGTWSCERGTRRMTLRAPGGGWGWPSADGSTARVRGVDARGLYDVGASMASLDGEWRPFGGSRALLFAMQVDGGHAIATTPAGRAFTASDTVWAGQTERMTFPHVLPLSGGAVIARQSALSPAPTVAIDVVRTIDVHGARSSPDAFAWALGGDRMSAVLASGAPGVARLVGDFVYFAGAGGAISWIGPAPDTLVPCDRGEVRARMAQPGASVLFEGRGIGGGTTTVLYAVVNGAMCFELVAARNADLSTTFVAADHGEMVGAYVAADGRATELTCTTTDE